MWGYVQRTNGGSTGQEVLRDLIVSKRDNEVSVVLCIGG